MKEKELGKIESVSFGLGGYQGSMIGVHFQFSGKGWGCGTTKSTWDAESIKWSANCKWTENERDNEYAQIIRFVSKKLQEAKVTSVGQLKGIPVECEFENGALASWRILEEVL